MFGTNPIDFHSVAYPQNSYNKSLVGFTPMKCITGDYSVCMLLNDVGVSYSRLHLLVQLMISCRTSMCSIWS